MKRAKKLQCKRCGCELLNFSLAGRTNQDGRPMTKADAIHLFVDPLGGRCTDCYLAHQREETSKLCRKKLLEQPPPMFEQLDLLALRQRVLKVYGIYAGTRENADRVNAMNREELIAALP